MPCFCFGFCEHEVPNDRRTEIQRDTNDQYRFESCAFSAAQIKRLDRGEKKAKGEGKETKREERLGIKVLLKYKNNLKIHIKTKLKFTDRPDERRILKGEHDKERNKSRNKNICSIFKSNSGR